MSAGNSSNPRLDRIEKLLEQTAREHTRAINENARAIQDVRRLSEEGELRSQKAHARIERDLTRVERDLKRWAALGVQEARDHRKRMLEIDRKIDQLSSAQLLTEETLRRFLASQTRGNGRGKT